MAFDSSTLATPQYARVVYRQVELLGVDRVFLDAAVLQFADQRFAGDRDFVETFSAMDGERVRTAKSLQHAYLDADQIGVEDAEDLIGRVGRVGQRPEDVEQGAYAQFAPYRCRMLHGAVMIGGKHEADAHFIDARPRPAPASG
jgi:hypothetical protein